MNIEKLAIVISGVDSTSNMFNKINNNVKRMSADFMRLWSGGNKFAAIQKGLGGIAAGSSKYAAMLGGVVAPGLAKIASTQDSFNMVQNLTGKTAEEMKHFRAQIFQIAADTGQSAEALIDAAAKNIKSGMDEADVFYSLKQAGTYATATHSKNLAEIANATHVFTRQMKMSHKEAADSFAGILEISKDKGKMTFEDLISGAQAMLGEASGMGVTREKGLMQIMAAAQMASLDTENAGEAISSVQSLFADLKTAKQEKALEAAGLGGLQERSEASGNYIANVVKEVMEKTDGNEVELSKIFKSASTRNLIRTISDDLKNTKDGELSKYEESFHRATKADGSKVIEAQKVAMNSLSAQWTKFQNQVTKVGDEKLTPWLGRLTGLMGWLSKDTWKARAAVNGFVWLAGIAIVAKGASGLMSIGKSLLSVGKSAITATTSVYRFIAANALAIKQHGFGFWANSQLPGLSKATTAVWGFVKAIYAKTAAWAKTAAMKTGSFFTSIAGGLKTASIATWGFVKALIAQAAAWALTPIGMITIAVTALVTGAVLIWKNWDKVVGWFKGAWNWFSGLWAKMPGWVQWLFPIIKITTIIVKNWDKVKEFFGNLWGYISGAFKKVWNFFTGVQEKFKEVGTNILKKIWDGISGYFGTLWNNFKVGVKAILFTAINFYAKFRETGRNLLTNIWNGISGYFGTLWNNFKSRIKGVLFTVINLYSKFKDAGANIIKNIWEGIKGMVSKPVDAVKGMVEKIRKFLPFSPAKEGPLKDLHKLKFSETIAHSIKPAPLLSKVTGVFGKVKEAMPRALTTAASIATAPLAAMAPQPAQPIQITINIDARGAAPGVEHDLRKAVMAMVPQIERALEQSQARKARVKH